MLIYKKKLQNALIGIAYHEIELRHRLYKLPSIVMHFGNDQCPDEEFPDVQFYDMQEFFKAVTPDDIRKLT